MILLGGTLTVLIMATTGLILFRALARRLLSGDEAPSERELLLLGILPGFALVGLVVTYLAIFHLFRPWIVLGAVAVVFGILRRDAKAVLSGVRDSVAAILAAARNGNLFPLLAALTGGGALTLGIHLCLMPSDIADVWAYHIPIAHSFLAHHGIVSPQIHHMFYGNNPLLFELLFATAMMAVDHYAAAGIVNVAIYFGLMFLILSFTWRARGFQFLLLCLGLVWAGPFFLLSAAQPMIDVPRSCFSVGAYLFAYRYTCGLRRFDLTMSALLAGAAVAGKYTELVTPALICVTLAPITIPRRQTWNHLVPAAIAFLSISSFWYLKNAILYGNPIYPFLFAHPGLSDAWMADYMRDIGQPFDAVERTYSRNLLTAQGWHDFAIAVLAKFRSLIPMALLAAMGLALPRPRRWVLFFWSVALFVIWYVVMFNGRRWGISATLLMIATAFINWAWMLDYCLDRWAIKLPARRYLSLALSGTLAVILLIGAGGIACGGFLMPRWIDAKLASSLGGPVSVAHYLAAAEPGYAVSRFIGQHHLGKVLQPLAEKADMDVAAFNGGEDNNWILEPALLPSDVAGTQKFVRAYGVHYFIESDRFTSSLINGRVRNTALARAVIARLKPGATLVLRDPSGFSLYRISKKVSP